MTFQFRPSEDATQALKVPYLEDARKNTAPNYASEKTLVQAMSDVTAGMGKLGAGVLEFQPGVYDVNGQDRHGYLIRFTQGGLMGIVRVAGLPIRAHTAAKEKQVRVQALLTVADWLKSAYTAQIFSPDVNPLLGFLLLPDGRTVAEVITSGQLLLTSGGAK